MRRRARIAVAAAGRRSNLKVGGRSVGPCARCAHKALRYSHHTEEPVPPVILSEAKNLNACQREMLRLRLSMTAATQREMLRLPLRYGY
jgi:hypothetical protein